MKAYDFKKHTDYYCCDVSLYTIRMVKQMLQNTQSPDIKLLRSRNEHYKTCMHILKDSP